MFCLAFSALLRVPWPWARAIDLPGFEGVGPVTFAGTNERGLAMGAVLGLALGLIELPVTLGLLPCVGVRGIGLVTLDKALLVP